MEYNTWEKVSCDRTKECVLKTIDKIISDNEGSGRLYAQDLDDLLDCWKILYHIRSEHSVPEMSVEK